MFSALLTIKTINLTYHMYKIVNMIMRYPTYCVVVTIVITFLYKQHTKQEFDTFHLF